MIINPIQNTGVLKSEWVQVRPRITQKFGLNPGIYKQFGLDGHNGLDYGVPVGTLIHAPIEGIVTVGNEGTKGYGTYVKIRKDNLEVTLGHLSSVSVHTGTKVYLGDIIAKSGNTGFSTGPHLHITVKSIKDGKVLNSDNGYKGAIDPLPLIINWKI